MNNLLEYCRYYKGEDECPEDISKDENGSSWFYEKLWVQSDDFRDEKGYNTTGYIDYGLKDFNVDDGVPITLKALLFNRYCHWSGGYGNDVEGFKKWYKKYYLNS